MIPFNEECHAADELSTQTGSIVRPVQFLEPYFIAAAKFVTCSCAMHCDLYCGLGMPRANGLPIKARATMNLDHTATSLRFVDEASFNSEVLQPTKAVLVAFWAPWSKPCCVIEPVLQDIAETCRGKIAVVKVNADDNPNLSLWLGVQHIPTLLHFEAGQLRGHLVGTVSKEAILSLLSRTGGVTDGNAPSKNGEAI
jgi:thioredoxin 1